MKKLGKARKIKRTGKELTFEIKFTKAGYKFLTDMVLKEQIVIREDEYAKHRKSKSNS